MSVFVVDRHHQPLMPCSEKRARLLLARKRAVVHRYVPFVIRLTDRTREQSEVQPVALKLDPGSKTTGMALVRVEPREEGEAHHALHLANLSHRGEQVHQALTQRRGYRRRRRTANLRYRAALRQPQAKSRVVAAQSAHSHRQCPHLGHAFAVVDASDAHRGRAREV